MASITDNNTVVPAVVTTEPVSCPATGNSSATSEGSQKVQSSLTHVAALLLTLKTVYSLSESCVKALLLLMVVLVKVVGTAFGAKNADIKLFLAVFPTSEHSLRTIAGTNRGCEFSSTSVAQSAIRYTLSYKTGPFIPIRHQKTSYVIMWPIQGTLAPRDG